MLAKIIPKAVLLEFLFWVGVSGRYCGNSSFGRITILIVKSSLKYLCTACLKNSVNILLHAVSQGLCLLYMGTSVQHVFQVVGGALMSEAEGGSQVSACPLAQHYECVLLKATQLVHVSLSLMSVAGDCVSRRLTSPAAFLSVLTIVF